MNLTSKQKRYYTEKIDLKKYQYLPFLVKNLHDKMNFSKNIPCPDGLLMHHGNDNMAKLFC
ncbi:MAG: hypothetical protein Q3971_00375 [Moraxella sp.]|nr:hypothetical protein [Moraxella sp.]